MYISYGLLQKHKPENDFVQLCPKLPDYSEKQTAVAV